jgi:hypothetical protein
LRLKATSHWLGVYVVPDGRLVTAGFLQPQGASPWNYGRFTRAIRGVLSGFFFCPPASVATPHAGRRNSSEMYNCLQAHRRLLSCSRCTGPQPPA